MGIKIKEEKKLMTFVKILLLIAGLTLIVSVLMQSGKNAGLSGSIGGGAEQLFGKQKAEGFDSLFDKITKVSAILFIILSILVAIMEN